MDALLTGGSAHGKPRELEPASECDAQLRTANDNREAARAVGCEPKLEALGDPDVPHQMELAEARREEDRGPRLAFGPDRVLAEPKQQRTRDLRAPRVHWMAQGSCATEACCVTRAGNNNKQ